MPRYNIARPDARDLIAYLKVIQDDFDPGVSTDEIVVGTLQPGQPLQDRLGDAMIAVMQARFDEVNRQGAVYDKRLNWRALKQMRSFGLVYTASGFLSDCIWCGPTAATIRSWLAEILSTVISNYFSVGRLDAADPASATRRITPYCHHHLIRKTQQVVQHLTWQPHRGL